MQHWNVKEFTSQDGSRSPAVLHSQEGESRVVAIHLQAGQELGDHEVKEAALLVVADGSVRIDAGSESIDAGAGTVVRFEPQERHSVAASGDARVLLVLAPWPGEGHYYRGEERAGATASSSPDAAA